MIKNRILKPIDDFWNYSTRFKRRVPTQLKRNVEYNQNKMVWCSHCSKFKPVTEFTKSKNNTINNGYGSYCSHCHNSRRVKRYSEDEKYRNKIIKSYRNNKQVTVDMLGGKCQRCGYSEFNEGLHHHHVIKSEKSHNVGSSFSLEKNIKEADKCCLLCLPCHFAYEHNKWGNNSAGDFVKVEYGYILKSEFESR